MQLLQLLPMLGQRNVRLRQLRRLQSYVLKRSQESLRTPLVSLKYI